MREYVGLFFVRFYDSSYIRSHYRKIAKKRYTLHPSLHHCPLQQTALHTQVQPNVYLCEQSGPSPSESSNARLGESGTPAPSASLGLPT